MRQKVLNSKGLLAIFALAIAFVMVTASAANAFATDNTAGSTCNTSPSNSAIVSNGLTEGANTTPSTTSFATDQAKSAQQLKEETYPPTFSLGDYNGKNCLTSVKLQNPWGNCWAFGITAAAETSILSESTQKTADQLDLSERHLAWFAKTHIPAEGEEGYNPTMMNNQSGEGVWYTNDATAKIRMNSGFPFYGSISYASGQGAVEEYVTNQTGQKVAFAPYKNDEGHLQVYLPGSFTPDNYYGDDSVEQAKASGKNYYYGEYAKEDTWSLNENKRFAQSYKLENSNILPDVKPVLQQDGTYKLNEAGVNAFKKELSQGRGINVVYRADQGNPCRYININNNIYSHFTWKPAIVDHSVAIVGWDDNYSAENFTITNPCKADAAEHKIYRLKQTGEDLKNDAAGNPLDPVTGQPAAIDAKEPSFEHADTHKTVKVRESEKWVYHRLGNGNPDMAYTDDGTSLKDAEGQSIDAKRIVMVAFNEDGSAKRDANKNPIYCKWTPEGPGKEYKNDENGNPVVDGKPLTDKVVVEYSYNDLVYKPAGDGAWIVKNSWGAESNDIPNKFNWGTGGSGYFYLSFYDLSVERAETFDFAVSDQEKEEVDAYSIYQYDYMPSESMLSMQEKYKLSSANVFPAEDNVLLKSLSCETNKPNTTVEYEVYKLNKDFKNPTDGTLVAKTQNTTPYEFAGYHRESLGKH